MQWEAQLSSSSSPDTPQASSPQNALTVAQPSNQRSLFSRVSPWLVFIAALLSTIGAWKLASINAERLASERFENRVERVRMAIVDRISAYQQLLRAGAALFAGSDEVSSDEWQRFYQTLQVEDNYPGLLGFGYAKRILGPERENSPASASLAPPSLPETVVIVYLEPDSDLNRHVVGLNMFADATRREAMLRAATTGQVSISGKTLLFQDQGNAQPQPGVLIYQPVYSHGNVAPAQRRQAIEGYVFGAFRMHDLMQAMFASKDDIALEIYDGRTLSAQTLLYDGRSKKASTPRFSARTVVHVSGREWTVQVSSGNVFEAGVYRETSGVILVAGLAISILLFALTLTLSRLREHALELARGMTATIKENEQRLREITASLGEGVYVKDLDGTITFVNPEAEKLLGWKAEEVLGTNAHLLYHHHKLDGTEYPIAECPIMHAALSGETYRAEDYFWHKNGAVLPISITSTPIYRNGVLAGAVNVFHDITERKRAEAQVRENQQFRALFDYAREALFLVDASGFIIDVNHVATDSLRCERAQILGRPARDFMASPMWSDGGATLATVIRRAGPEAPVIVEGEHICRDGTRFPVEALFSPIQIGTRELILIAARDITERKRADAERRELLERERRARENAEAAQKSLARSNADLEHFAYAASHDLQEPLRMVTAYNQLLQKRYSGNLDREADQFIEYSISGARRMEQLLQALLSYLRVAAADEVAEPVDANRVLQEALQNLHTVIEESGARIDYAQLPPVRAHAVHVLQLFQNLIGNAIKYRSAETPRIQIGAQQQADDIWIFSIADNGIGVEPRYADHIFGIFKRLHGEQYGGTGIGLAICQKIVERYGGRIWVESGPLGGSVFRFSLPG